MSVEIVHLIATAFMAGLIVFVQVVHYPLMGQVGSSEFTAYETAHTVRTGWVVIPPMVLELATAVWILFAAPGESSRGLAIAGAALLAVIWISTAILQAPAHGRLVHGFDEVVHRRLVSTNWIRTVAWLARVPIAALLLG